MGSDTRRTTRPGHTEAHAHEHLYRRSASSSRALPFAQEISRLGGTLAVFTPERANRLHREAIRQARRHFEQLAAESRRRVTFEVLVQTDTARVEQLAAEPRSALVAPDFILASPIYDSFVHKRRRIVLVPAKEGQHEGH